MKPIKNIGLFVILIALVGGFMALLRQMNQNAQQPPEVTPEVTYPTAAPPAEAESVTPPPATTEKTKVAPEGLWQVFRLRYGENLHSEFDARGCLSAITGAPNQGSRASGTFHTDQPQEALARARQILSEAQDLLCLSQTSFQLDEGMARGSLASVQVNFRQASSGIPLEPHGNLTISLGPQGEILGLQSDLVLSASIANEVRIDALEARTRAVSEMMPDLKGPEAKSPAIDGGNHVLWVSAGTARHAYSFFIQGRQIVIDAQTGGVIFKRDRRIQ